MKNIEKKSVSVPFSRCYWVLPGQFLAGCYPGSKDTDEAGLKLKAMLDLGIRHIVNLMEHDEKDQTGAPFVRYEDRMQALAASKGCSVTFERMSIRDLSVPSKARMSAILDRVDQCVRDNRRVYVHCLGGRGRTGTVVGCYLSRHGIATGEKVLDSIARLRKVTDDYYQPSPETRPQLEMVRSWSKGC